jgi:hypothetical protein
VDVVAEDVGEGVHVVGGGFGHFAAYGIGQVVAGDECLQDVELGALYPLADGAHLVFVVPGLDYGRPKFVPLGALAQQGDGLGDAIDVRKSGPLGVVGGREFDVHRHVVDHGQEFFEHVGAGSVGVELDAKVPLAEFLDDLEDVGVEGGFAAGHHDAFDPVVAELLAGFLDVGPAHGGGVDVAHQRGVVAEAAAEVAAADEKDGGHLAGIVDHRGILQNAEDGRGCGVHAHGRTPYHSTMALRKVVSIMRGVITPRPTEV